MVTEQCGKHILAPKIQSDILTKETERYVVPPVIPNPKKKLVQAGFSGYFLR